MFGIEEDFTAAFDDEADTVLDHRKILLKRGTDDVRNMKVPAFAEDGDDWSLCSHQTPKVRVLGSKDLFSARRTETDELGMLELKIPCPCEKFQVLRI
ncbi:hypothetical protein SDC9_121347 [bioreactor metagenome]|uniref:Uncharacterized protein n=1 Tax=bioreactor metagenome TaxID=1076179 RepID=A0A645CBQ4_9ZZZZ